jgi:hypothetical protein
MFRFLNKLWCGLEASSLGSQLNHGIMRCENITLIGACVCTEISRRVTSWYTHTRKLAGINPGPSRPERDVWLVGCTKRAINSLLSAWLLSVWYRHDLPVGFTLFPPIKNFDVLDRFERNLALIYAAGGYYIGKILICCNRQQLGRRAKFWGGSARSAT